LIYVGSSLSKISNSYGSGVEPALINPKLKVNRRTPDFIGSTLGYWPSYSGLSPNARAAYLTWLANGKSDPDVPIGYVFLYYYGLERRLLFDLKGTDKKDEIESIKNEVKRLSKIYGSNNSFRRYASQFLALFELFDKDEQNFSVAIERENLNFNDYYNNAADYYSYDLNFKKGLGYFAIHEKPLPADWALKWAVKSTQLNTPATRCKDKFQELFRIEYTKVFGKGVILSDYQDTIMFRYRPASSSFGGNSINIETNIPDFHHSEKYTPKFRKLIDLCTDKLDPYSRYLGRNPDDYKSAEAISNLPVEIISEYLSPDLKNFIAQIDQKLENRDCALIATEHFTEYWDITGVKKYRKKESIGIAQFFFKIGYGVEPDLRFGSAKFERESRVVFFKINPETYPKAPSKEYKLALLVSHLTTVVGLADGTFSEDEQKYLHDYIESLFKLSNEERSRLNAYLHWLKAENPGIRGIKKKISDLNQSKRKSILEFLIKVANTDGYIDPEEVKMLQKTAEIFELDPDQIYTDIHTRQIADNDPILIVKGEKKKGYSIPDEKQKTQNAQELDEDLIKQTMEQTDEVQGILSDIFMEDEEELEIVEKINGNSNKSILGLDELHSKLVTKLLVKEAWTQLEYENLCSEFNLFPAGAQEVINDKSFDKYDDALLLEFEQIEINTEIAKAIQL